MITDKDYTIASHWDRLDKVIKTLIYKDLVHNDTDFYYQLELDISSASLIRTRKRKLPKKARYRLFEMFDVNEDFLMKGELPILNYGGEIVDYEDVEDEIAILKEKIDSQQAKIEEMRAVLKEAIKFGKLDLQNKGLLDD